MNAFAENKESKIEFNSLFRVNISIIHLNRVFLKRLLGIYYLTILSYLYFFRAFNNGTLTAAKNWELKLPLFVYDFFKECLFMHS